MMFLKGSFILTVCFVVVILGLSFSGQGNAGEYSVQSGDCCKCHAEVCDDQMVKPYVHAPVLEKKCGVCHVEPVVARVGAGDKRAVASIKWVARNFDRAKEHWFQLDSELAGKVLVCRSEGADNNMYEIEVRLPQDFKALQEIANNKNPPEISDLRVKEVVKGMLLTATVSWKTDKPADSAVLYGVERLDNMTPVDSRLTLEHEVLISGLAGGKTYKAFFVSKDLFGNKAKSKEISFSTASPMSMAAVTVAGDKATKDILSVDKELFSAAGQFLLKVTANQPVTAQIGLTPKAAKKAGGPVMSSVGLPAGHRPLADLYTITTAVCLTCHPATKGILSHPINVYPKNGMVIPDDYRTLPDGRLSCMSCHEPHASEYEYRISRPSKKALCLGCHKNFG